MFGTEIHALTFFYICIFIIMLFPVIYNITKGKYKRYHIDFFILLICILINNLSSGLFPDVKFSINVLSQNIIAYFVGFTTIVYYFLYVSKYYNINFRKYINVNQVLLILFVDLVIGFIIPYTITNDIALARKIFLVAPILLIMGLIFVIIKQKVTNYFFYDNIIEKYHVFTGIMGIVSIISNPIIMFTLGDNQDIEQTFFNVGFFFIAIEYFLYQKTVQTSVMQENYSLTQREAEILSLVIINPNVTYTELGNNLNISEKTISAHMSRIYKKTGAKNKKDLYVKISRDHEAEYKMS